LFEGATIGKTLYVNIDAIPKEDRDNFINDWLASTPSNYILSESHLPITQEFIESFGFEHLGNGYYEHSNGCQLEQNLKTYALTDKKQDIVFSEFDCTTQSELRFLLTKGRIDCSK